jgi:hypothetical protein
VWTAIGAIAVGAAMVGALWVLRASREVYHPWYAQMGRAAAFMIASGIAAGWLISRAGALLPARAHGERHPALTWVVALPFWIAAAAAALWFAPGASYLATIPLLTAAVLLLATPLRSGLAVRIASLIVLGIAGSIWLANTVDLLHFLNALIGRAAVVAPLWIFPALLMAAGLFLIPPFIAAITAGSSGLTRPSILTAFCLILVAGTGVAAYFGDAYSDRHPLRRYARYVQDDGTKTAMWEIGSNEPGLDVAAVPELQWTPDTAATQRALAVSPMPWPYRFTAAAPSTETPATVTASVATIGEGAELTVTVRPHDPSARITLVLPAGMKPARANLPGIITSANRWRSIVAPGPADGAMWRIVVPAADQARLGETGVIVESAIAPGHAPRTLPPWMPNATAAWRVRSMYLIPIGPLLPAPGPLAPPAPAAGVPQ